MSALTMNEYMGKNATTVVVSMESAAYQGNIFLFPDERVSDFLNNDKKFVPLKVEDTIFFLNKDKINFMAEV